MVEIIFSSILLKTKKNNLILEINIFSDDIYILFNFFLLNLFLFKHFYNYYTYYSMKIYY